MKKAVVVVGNNKPITFEGERLHISNTADGLLLVQDLNRDSDKRDLGVFKDWTYWREVKSYTLTLDSDQILKLWDNLVDARACIELRPKDRATESILRKLDFWLLILQPLLPAK